MLNGCNVTSRMARQRLLASTQAMSSSPRLSWTRTGAPSFTLVLKPSLKNILRRAILDRKNRKKATGGDVEMVDVSDSHILNFCDALTHSSKPSLFRHCCLPSPWLSYCISKRSMYVCAYLAHLMLHEASCRHISCFFPRLPGVSFTSYCLPRTIPFRSVYVSMYYCLQCAGCYIDTAESGYATFVPCIGSKNNIFVLAT